MDVVNVKYEKIFPVESTLPKLDTPSLSPMFDYRRELRKDFIDPTSIALLTLVTIDKSCNETRIVGFAAIPLFINPETDKQP
jgi:hypothetical protein